MMMLAGVTLVATGPACAQWVQTNGPGGGSIRCFAVSSQEAGGTNIAAGTYGDGAFVSTNNGASWTEVSARLAKSNVWHLAASPDGNGGEMLFAGTSRGVWRRPPSDKITSVLLSASGRIVRRNQEACLAEIERGTVTHDCGHVAYVIWNDKANPKPLITRGDGTG
jgi:hypothetical protein